MEKQRLLNTYVNNVDWTETIQEIEGLLAREEPSYIVEVNVDVVLKLERDSYLKEIVRQADMVLVDGKPLQWIAKWQGNPVKEKISGSDLAEVICERAEKKDILFLFWEGNPVWLRRLQKK